MYYDYEENYYEPSVTDEILEEYQQKMKEVLLKSIKEDIKSIKEENKKFKVENEKYRSQIINIESRERQLEYREKDLERTVRNEFIKSKFSEILKPLEEQAVIWVKDSRSYLIKKCNRCDKDRKITYTSNDGEKILKDCSCKKYESKYIPVKCIIKTLNLYKDNREYYEKSKFIITPKYDSRDYDSEYAELKIKYIFDEFDIEKIEGLPKSYDNIVGFLSEEECRKYCEWLNSKKNNDDEEDE